MFRGDKLANPLLVPFLEISTALAGGTGRRVLCDWSVNQNEDGFGALEGWGCGADSRRRVDFDGREGGRRWGSRCIFEGRSRGTLDVISETIRNLAMRDMLQNPSS